MLNNKKNKEFDKDPTWLTIIVCSFIIVVLCSLYNMFGSSQSTECINSSKNDVVRFTRDCYVESSDKVIWNN